MSLNAKFTQQYKSTNLNTASPEKLVIMLYEGAIKFAKRAQFLIGEGPEHSPEVGRLLGKVQAILSELSSSLRADVGGQEAEDLVSRLTELYAFCIQRTIQCNIDRDPSLLDSVIKVVEEIREGFEGAVEQLNAS